AASPAAVLLALLVLLVLLLPLLALALLALPLLARELLDLGVEGRAAGLEARDVALVLLLLALELIALRLLRRVEIVQLLLRVGGLLLGLLGALDRLLGVDLQLLDLLAHRREALRRVLGDGLVGAQRVQPRALRSHGEAIVHGAVDGILRRRVAHVDRGRVGQPAALVGVQRHGGELAVAAVDLVAALVHRTGETLFLLLRRGEPLAGAAILLAGVLELCLGLLEILLRLGDQQLRLGERDVGVRQIGADIVEL